MAAVMAGCASSDGAGADDALNASQVTSAHDELAIRTFEDDPEPWPNGTISVCTWPIVESSPGVFINGSLTNANYLAAKAEMQAVVEGGYENVAGVGIDFTGWGNCPNGTLGSQVGKLRVSIELTLTTAASYGLCGAGATYPSGGCGGAGYDATLEGHIHIGVGAGRLPGDVYSAADWPSAVLHEFVHALSFTHEYWRADGDNCEDGGWLDDGTEGEFFTVYDTSSVANATYCHNNPLLSYHDKLGLSIVYPSASGLVQRVAAPAGLHIRPATLLVRSNDVLVQEWVRKGAMPAAFQDRNTSVYWAIDGGPAVAADPLSVSALPDNDTQVAGVFADYQGRVRYLEQTRVLVSNGLHTAIVMAPL